MTKDRKKIGILGGTFDPIHFGHLFLAQTALDAMDLDVVLVMPSPSPYYRTDKKVSDAEHRCNMIKLAIADNPDLEFSDFEIVHDSHYTCDTLEAFKKEHPDSDVYFILGGDSLFSIENWLNPDKIFANATILTSKRENQNKGASGSLKASDSFIDMDNDGINDREQVETLEDNVELQIEYLRRKFGARIVNVHVPNIEISSSEILRRIRDGRSVKYYLPDSVIDYIEKNKLYR
ncbi:MAG: nicotinate-nucleotide adenylyltransferase [Lachnospiraceae bacterium]|nr:nicotinate-nucleotide adenylyltransferase [Lachnospiraceae bacterium]